MRAPVLGSRTLSPAPLTSGDGLIVLETDMAALADDLVVRAETAIDRVLDPVVRRGVADAVARWPVRTGASKAGFRIEARRDPDGSLVWRIRNRVGYSGVIFDRGMRPALTYVRELVVPVREAVRKALPSVAREVARG